MKKQQVFFALACLLAVAVAQGLTGCSHQAGSMSATDKANFKGGPMPASAAKIFAQKMREANTPKPAPAASNP